MNRFFAPSALLRVLIVLIVALAIAVPTLMVRYAPPLVRHRVVRAVPQRIVPVAELPTVEPVAFQDLDPDDARAFNATVPFADGPNPAARPFKFAGDVTQRARAVDCMAAAVLYEAGDEPVGQRAVAQVVINRVRHPAFPKTICGVVFQGAERTTGCQFTFTCDGALVRHTWLDVQWARARQVATAALTGSVFKPVGYATHYHTDWVVPYWQSSLDKIAAVNTHLFFRWTGWWGTPPAFNRQVSADEPIIAQLADYSDAHKTGAALVEAQSAETDAPVAGAVATTEPTYAPLPSDSNTYLITLDPHMPADDFATLALRLCGDRPLCKVMAWSDKIKTATAWPLKPEQMTAMSFSYLRDQAHSYERTQWNCAEFHRTEPKQCMRVQAVFSSTRGTAATADAAHAPIVQVPAGDGVHRKADLPLVKPAPPAKQLSVSKAGSAVVTS
jgi:spore germination cell wall hydrolase CwlJ-like protein